jgi:formylglycine-generating enzyme
MKRPLASTLGLVLLSDISLVTPVLAAITTTDSFGSGVNAFTMDFVTVGDPGNTADTTGAPNPAGAVGYTYRMGSYEVSEDMINKANAEGGLGISKDTRGTNKVATAISWNEAARFVNYLNVTSGSTPAYKFITQPGDGGYSANANITQWAPGDAGYDVTNPFRNRNANYFLPSENEWYKAAYYSSSGTYYDYTTGSDTIPTAVVSGTVEATAVYGQSLSTGPADITSAGGLSPYGTMGQGGNAWEWLESEYDGVNNSPGSPRGVRGGSWSNAAAVNSMANSFRWYNDPAVEGNSSTGFRVASVPEPSAMVLAVLFGAGLVCRRKR